MANLDVSPMIAALRSSPEAFEFNRGTLHHIPSRHSFQFNAKHHVRIDADCGCSLLTVSTDQGLALYQAFQQWRSSYWRPIEINREFASHFASPSRLRSRLIKLTGWLHRVALTPRSRTQRKSCEAMVPAE